MDFYAPQFNPQPDFLRSYLQGATTQNAITQSNQATQEGALQLQRNQIQAQVLKQYMDELHGQQAGAQNQTGGNSGGIQNGPQSSVSQPSAQGQNYQPNGWTPQAANIFTPNVSPSTMAAMSLVSPDTVKAMVEAQKSQLQTAQLHALDPNGGSALPTLIGLANDPNAAQALKNNPQLLQSWEIAARSAGVDPAKLFSDKPGEADYAVKTVAYQMASPTLQQLGLQDRIKRPEYQSTVNGPLGSVYQQDSDTQKLTQVKGEESLHQVVGPNGPEYLPASAASGRQPYNAATFVNAPAASSIAEAIASYKMAPLTGFALKSAQGQETMRQVLAVNPSYDATQYQAKQQAYNKFTAGKQGDTVRSLSVATDHLAQLQEAANALNNGDTQAVNKVINYFSQQTGNPKATNFNAMKEIVGDEVVKAVVGAGGGVGDRDAIKAAFDASSSPAQLLGTINKYIGLMGGQLSGLKRQYENATGRDDFNNMVSDRAIQQLEGGQQQPASPSNGWGKAVKVNK